jgi:hypothetical protein
VKLFPFWESGDLSYPVQAKASTFFKAIFRDMEISLSELIEELGRK